MIKKFRVADAPIRGPEILPHISHQFDLHRATMLDAQDLVNKCRAELASAQAELDVAQSAMRSYLTNQKVL